MQAVGGKGSNQRANVGRDTGGARRLIEHCERDATAALVERGERFRDGLDGRLAKRTQSLRGGLGSGPSASQCSDQAVDGARVELSACRELGKRNVRDLAIAALCALGDQGQTVVAQRLVERDLEARTRVTSRRPCGKKTWIELLA